MADKKKSCGCTLTQPTAKNWCQPAPAGLESKVYFSFPNKPVLKGSVSVAIDTDGDAEDWQPENYEVTVNGLIHDVDDRLMRMLSQSMRFDRKTLRRLFHAVTHRKQVWFDVVIEFGDSTIDEGGLIVRTPHELRFLLNKIRHIRTQYKISDRED